MKIRRRASIAIQATISIAACIFALWSCSRGFISEDLYTATTDKDYGKMQIMIKLGADVNFKFMGTTPVLQTAIDNDDAKAAAILLSHGASIEELDGHYQRLLKQSSFLRALANEHFFLK